MNTPDGLDDWLELVAHTLDVSPAGIDAEELLSVAKEVAHHRIRPGAPTSTFYVGYALGLWEESQRAKGVTPTDAQKATRLHELSELIRQLALSDKKS